MTQIPKPTINEPKRNLSVTTSQLKAWLQMLEEMAQGPKINAGTNHTKNLEEGLQKMINMSKQLAGEFAEVVDSE